MLNQDKAINHQLSQLNRVLISLVDFEHCHGVTKHILEKKLHELDTHSNRYLLEGMCVGMIVAYCRPFSGNNGGDLPNRFINNLNDDEKETHHHALLLRHKALAHSDNEAWEMSPHYIKTESNERILVPFYNCVHDPVSISFTTKLMHLAKKQWKQCIKFQKELEELVGEHIPIFEI